MTVTEPKAARRRKVTQRLSSPGAGRVPALDGLRGLALLAVLAYHTAPAAFRGGFLGVEMFFVLSGFLLTTLLLDEHRRKTGIDVIAYATRRVRRIAPALLVLLMAIAVAGRFLAADEAHRLAKDVLSSLAGFTNWRLILEGNSYFAHTGRPPLVRHLWSIAVELQAYVVLPVVALVVARRSRRVAITALLAGTALSATAMGLLYHAADPSRAYYGTDTRIGSLLTGALVSVLVSRHGRKKDSERPLRPTVFLTATAVISLAALFVGAGERSRLLYPAGFLATQAATGVLIAAAMHHGATSRSFGTRPMRWLGTRSYGIYLWHWPLVVLLRPGIDVSLPRWATSAICLAGALALGALSYRFVELPFLRAQAWARRPLPVATRLVSVAWVAAVLVVVALVARSAPVDPIASSLAAGEHVLAEQGVSPSPSPTHAHPIALEPTSTGARARPAPVAAGRLPTTNGPPPGTVKLAAVGDSVMLGAAPQLKARFGPSGYIDAVKSRHFGEGVQVVHDLRAQQRLGRVLVVHLGNNGPVKPEEVDTMMKEATGLYRFLLVTVRVDRDWQDEVNATLKDAAKRYKTIRIVDWFRVSQGHRDWFYKDGTHVNHTGADAYAKLVSSAVPPEPTPAPKPTAKPTPTPTPKPTLVPVPLPT